MVALAIMEGMKLIGTLLPQAVSTAQQIKEALSSTGNITVDIIELTESAIHDSDETLKMIEEWKKSKGIA